MGKPVRWIKKIAFICLVSIILGAGLLVNEGATQSQLPADLQQFPKLTERKAFQRWWWAFRQRAYPLDDLPKGAQRCGQSPPPRCGP